MKIRFPFGRAFAAGIAFLIAGATLVACGGGYGGGGGTYMPPPPPPPSVVAGYRSTSLVSDTVTAGVANTDAKLVNAWGIAFNPTGFVWVANNGSDTSTLYDGNGVPQTLVVTTQPAPTGIVFNGSQDFKVSQGGVTAASPFVFASEGGMISGWSPTVNLHAVVNVVDGSSASKVYKGLATAAYLGLNYLYAADFHNNATAPLRQPSCRASSRIRGCQQAMRRSTSRPSATSSTSLTPSVPPAATTSRRAPAWAWSACSIRAATSSSSSHTAAR
jgi:hypothetical protein